MTLKQFFSKWKAGIEGVTPLQQINIQIKSSWIIVVGILAGIVVSLTMVKTLWWLILILVGSLFNSVIQLLALYQKKFMIQKFDLIVSEEKEVNNGKQ